MATDRRRIAARRLIAALIPVLWLALSPGLSAHEIPTDVTVRAFAKPEGRTLRLLVRVPLQALRDVEFPSRGPGYIDLERASPALRNAATQWIGDSLEVHEGDTRLGYPRVAAVQVSLPSDRSFTSYADALAHTTGAPLPSETEIYWGQALLDVLFEYPIQSDRSDFAIRAGLERLGLRVVVALQFLSPTGVDRAFEFAGDEGLVRLDPRWYQAALRFVGMGFLHILDGTDHLLFLLCLIIPFRRTRELVEIVTSFTLAHSVTLIASAYDLAPSALWFPPLIETLIAVSIVYMAFENIVGPGLQRRWLITFGFGLVHGFGFSFALRQTLQFAGSHVLTSLLSFNVGVELGQLLVLAVALPLLNALFRFVVAERVGTILLSALVAHTAWHWMIERWDQVRQFPWPDLGAVGAAELASGLRLLMLIVAVAGLTWLLFGVLLRRSPQGTRDKGVVPLEESN